MLFVCYIFINPPGVPGVPDVDFLDFQMIGAASRNNN